MIGVPPNVREMAQAKVHKSSFLAFPWLLMVSGKQRSSFPSASTFSDILIPLGSVGLDVGSSVGLPFPFPMSRPEADFFTLAHVGDLIPPSISTPKTPLNQ
jgi:hypothetical protein